MFDDFVGRVQARKSEALPALCIFTMFLEGIAEEENGPSEVLFYRTNYLGAYCTGALA